MKICLVSQQYPPDTAAGGIGTQTMLKAQHLARRGHTVHVVSSTLDGPARVARDGDVTVHRLPYPTVDTPFCETSVLWIGFSYAVAAKLADLTERIDFDLIEFPEYGAEGFVYQIERPQPRRVPVVVMLHGSLAMFAERVGWPEPDSDLWRFGSFQEEQAILKADLLLAASHNIAAFWQARLGDRLPPVEVIHTAVDPTGFQGDPLDRRSRPGRPTILFVGRVDRAKGVVAVAEAVARLRSRYPDILFRVVGGGDEGTLARLRAIGAAGGAASCIELVGYADYASLGRYYAECDVFASPAPHEHGVATVYLEAMAAGKPVVAGATGGAPEAVLDGRTGLLIPPDDADALVAALDRLLSSPSLRQQLGANGRRRVETYFAAERMVERVEAIYGRLIGRWGGPNAAAEAPLGEAPPAGVT